MSRLPARPSSLTPQAVDVLIALGLLVALELEVWLGTAVEGRHRQGASIVVVFLVAPVAVRRRWPGLALVASATVAGAAQAPWAGLSGVTGTVFPVLLLAFTAGTQLDLRRGLAVAATAAALIAGGAVWSTVGPATGSSLGSDLFAAIALPLIFWALGWIWHERSRRALAFRDLAGRVERERQRHERAAAAHERVRIGRELQDIIAQNVSAIIIQAGGARQLIDVDPARAADAILSVERAGREALGDLRRTLGLLRTDEDPRVLTPQPGLAQLGSLLETARARGFDCAARTEGEPGELATGIDLVGYRVIEAALQTSDEHRRPSDVVLGYSQTELKIEVRGRGPIAGLDEQLRGISERVALYNGSVAIRPVNTDGYLLSVRLPRQVTSQ